MASVSRYRLWLYGSAQTRTDGALIILEDQKDSLGRIVFFRDMSAANPTDHMLANGLWEMHLPMSELATTLDVLRNEAPLNAAYVSPESGDPYVQITSGSEPVGEGET